MSGIKNFFNCIRESERDFEADKKLIDEEDCVFTMKYLGVQNISIWSDRRFMTSTYKDQKAKTHFKIKGKMNISTGAVVFTKSNEQEVKRIPRVQEWWLSDIESVTEIGRSGLALAVLSKQKTAYDCHCFKIETCTAKRVRLALDYAGSQAQERNFQREVQNLKDIQEELTRRMESGSYSNTDKDKAHLNLVHYAPNGIVFPSRNSARGMKDIQKAVPFSRQFSMILKNAHIFDSDSDDDC